MVVILKRVLMVDFFHVFTLMLALNSFYRGRFPGIPKNRKQVSFSCF